MAQYELDVAADQIVQWLKAEVAAGRRDWGIRATREFAVEPVERPAEAGLDEEPDEASLVTLGVLEVWPLGPQGGWTLQVRVEDILGPHTPEDESVPEGAEEIDLNHFEAQFLVPDRSAAFVSVEAESVQAKRRFDRVLADLVRNRHPG
jgi:hypothetical protein